MNMQGVLSGSMLRILIWKRKGRGGRTDQKEKSDHDMFLTKDSGSPSSSSPAGWPFRGARLYAHVLTSQRLQAALGRGMALGGAAFSTDGAWRLQETILSVLK